MLRYVKSGNVDCVQNCVIFHFSIMNEGTSSMFIKCVVLITLGCLISIIV